MRIIYLIIIFFSATFIFPDIAYDPIIDYYRLKQQYKWLTPPVFYAIDQEINKYDNVTADDICALIQYESGNYCYNKPECMQKVHSYAGAIGYMQIMPFHHKGPRTDLYQPHLNIMYGVRYYSWCLKYMKGNKKEALRCYNAGPASNKNRYSGWKGYVYPIIRDSNKSEKIYNEYLEIK